MGHRPVIGAAWNMDVAPGALDGRKKRFESGESREVRRTIVTD